MADWIKWVVGLERRVEVLSIAQKLRKDPDLIAAKLMRVWAWADSETTDGLIPGLTLAHVDRFAGLKGLGLAMTEVGDSPHSPGAWLKSGPDGLRFKDWDKHNSESAKKRALDSERQRRKRVTHVSQKCHADSVTNVTQMSRSERDKSVTRREEIRRDKSNTEDKTKDNAREAACCFCGISQSQTDIAFENDHFVPRSAGGSDEPENMNLACHTCNQIKSGHVFRTIQEARVFIHNALWTKNRKRYEKPRQICFGGKPPPNLIKPDEEMFPPGFLNENLQKAWSDWLDHLRQKNKGPTPTAKRLQSRKLIELGPERALSALIHSTTNGYTGIYEPDGDRKNGTIHREIKRSREYDEPPIALPIA